MTKHRSTKHALLMSVLSLIMCLSMFIGSTFAWFTDSVTSSGNRIQSGTLDVALEMWDGDSWENVDNEDKIFNYENRKNHCPRDS